MNLTRTGNAERAQRGKETLASIINRRPGLFGSRGAPASVGPIVGSDLSSMQVAPTPGFGGDAVGMGEEQPIAPANGRAQAGPLGQSMREPFDYEGAFKTLKGGQRDPKMWQYIAAALGDALVSRNGGTPWVTRSLVAQRDANQSRMQDSLAKLAEWKWRDHARQNEADLRAANPFTIGRDRLAYDPSTGQVQSLYDGQEDFELYAAELGLEPGTQEYFDAVEDYVLRSSGPSAYARDISLDDHRTSNDERLEGLRHGNRTSLERMRQAGRLNLRQTPAAPRQGGPGAGGTQMPTFATPQAAKASGLPSGTPFRTPDGRVKQIP